MREKKVKSEGILLSKRGFRVVLPLLILALLISLVSVNTVPVQAKTRKKTVVLYFSATGTTKSVAKKIQKYTKGTLIEIKASDPYTEEDLDWTDSNSRVTVEHESASSPAKSKVRPKIRNLSAIKKAVKKADIVYIGYPIWWGEAPHIMYSLVEKVSLKKKTVVPFSTSMSSGMGNSAKHLKKKAIISTKTKWLKGRGFYGKSTQKTINAWIKKLKL